MTGDSKDSGLSRHKTILVVDDEKSVRYSLRRMFEEKGYVILEAKSGQEAIGAVRENDIDLVLMDVKMVGMTGLEALSEIKKIEPKLLVIIMTAHGTTQTAIEAMKYGAFDYVLKPFDIPKMLELVSNALTVSEKMKESVVLEEEKKEMPAADRIIGDSPKMQEVYKLIGQVAEKDITVLLRGESGTGKELVARAIYHHSKRAGKTYLPINCAAIPETLLESELFGHEKGAFTDAHARRIGKFEQCTGGTIFLDEIGDMSLATQAKILRVLQEKEIIRLGSSEPIKVDVRLIVATNRDLEKAINEGKFREDLYYRLNVVTVNLPPLRERTGDIPQLAKYFLKKFNTELEKDIIGIDEAAMEKLSEYTWPGNVRELENVIKRACVLCKGAYISADELSLDLSAAPEIASISPKELKEESLDDLFDKLYGRITGLSEKERMDLMESVEKALIIRALRETNGNQLQAAKILGMNRNTLRSKIERYDIKISKDVE